MINESDHVRLGLGILPTRFRGHGRGIHSGRRPCGRPLPSVPIPHRVPRICDVSRMPFRTLASLCSSRGSVKRGWVRVRVRVPVPVPVPVLVLVAVSAKVPVTTAHVQSLLTRRKRQIDYVRLTLSTRLSTPLPNGSPTVHGALSQRVTSTTNLTWCRRLSKLKKTGDHIKHRSSGWSCAQQQKKEPNRWSDDRS